MPSRKVVPIASPPSTPGGHSKSICSPKQLQKLPPVQTENEIEVEKLLGQAKFLVFLARDPATGQPFALKMFPFEDNKPHPYFRNEVRFAGLAHPNVIKTIHVQDSTSLSCNGEEKLVSSLMMEYAPYGDFFDFLKKVQYRADEKLARTYFHQLIEGIEYLHKNNVLHLDIKLENLLIGEDYQLKIADFDLAYIKGDPDTLTMGTKYYRAPELRIGSRQVSEATDIYGAGVMLFVLKYGGVLPHLEEETCKGVNLRELMSENPAGFFDAHCHIQGQKPAFFSSSFKELFMAMMRTDPKERMSIKEIKKSKWYKGSVYSQKELKKVMKNLLEN